MPQSLAELRTGGRIIRNGEPNDPDRPHHAAAGVSERRHANARGLSVSHVPHVCPRSATRARLLLQPARQSRHARV